MSNVASANPEKTGDVPSAGGGGTQQLSNNTVIVVAGASGDLAKKKVSYSNNYILYHLHPVPRKRDKTWNLSPLTQFLSPSDSIPLSDSPLMLDLNRPSYSRASEVPY